MAHLVGKGMIRGVKALIRFKRRRSGQAAVETAIVMPLFLFCMMGFFQIMLMHQARLVTKYAAYKAVRTGALQRNDVQKMTRAALAVVTPMTLLEANGRMGNIQRFSEMEGNQYAGGPPVVEVTICAPVSGMVRNGLGPSIDFDEPSDTQGPGSDWGNQPDLGGTGNWRAYDSNKLSAQVLYNYRMFIPFVNALLFNLVRAQEKTDVMRSTRVGLGYSGFQQETASKDANGNGRKVQEYADTPGEYFMPIRASYVMRMHSNLNAQDLPARSNCIVPFRKRG
jgi:TadE-like protein